MVALIQQQTPNISGAIQSGFGMAQTARMNNLKALASNQTWR